jgi:hypothetical protein
VTARDPRPLMDGTCSGWAFPLFDVWGEKDGRLLYRHDNFWRGHEHPRVWMIRRPVQSDYVWNARGLHCGHLPSNLHFSRGIGIAPLDFSLLHFAYSDPFLRAEKHAQYLAKADILSLNERAHAASIADPHPNLYPVPFTPDYTLTRDYKQEAA